MKPKLTIIMSTYNDGKYLIKALQSILFQTLTDWNLIIVNDASDDNTNEIIKYLLGKDKRVKYIKNETRKGVTFNIKHSIIMAETELIARLDGDDYWTNKRKLEEQYEIMIKNQDLGMIGTWAKVINNQDKLLYTIEYSSNNEKMKHRALYENPFVTSSIMFRKPDTEDMLLLNPLNKSADDYNLVLQIGVKKKFANIKKFYTAYRINPVGISQSKYTDQISDTLRLINYYKKFYSGYFKAWLLWSMRKNYPKWLKGQNSVKLKKLLGYY